MLRECIAAILLAMALGASVPEVTDERVEVDLKQGKIHGVRESSIRDSRFYYSFRNIPYAEPPVGDLRFKDPVPAKPWTELRENVTDRACPQTSVAAFMGGPMEVLGDEDCLYLHVYTPRPYASDLPVMVYIHGGGFIFGNADNFGGTPQRLLTKDVVLVSIQYRLGTLGFLSTGDSVLPGNLGMKDQSLALQWVHDNIHELGGDISRITIFGKSAGAASTHFHTLTPYSKGLFNRVIMQSGTAISGWALRDDHAEIATKISQDLKCPGADSSPIDSTQLLECLKNASVEDLVLAPLAYMKMNMPFLMVPRVDGDYLPDHPAQLLLEGRYQKVDVMSGVCQHESGASILGFLSNDMMKKEFMDDFDSIGALLSGMDTEPDSHYLTRRVFYHYMDKIELTEDKADILEQKLSEGFLSMCHDEATVFHGRDSKYGKHVYRYELQHHGEQSFGGIFNNTIAKKYVTHADDLQYLFDGVFPFHPVIRPADVFLSEIMVSLWTNFAKTGNPTPDLQLGFKWEAMTSESDLRFLALLLSPQMKKDNRVKNREFWRNLPTKRNKIMFPDRFASNSETCHH